MAENDDKKVVIKPPLETVGHWIVILILPLLLAATTAWCCWVALLVEEGWFLALLGGLWVVGVLLLVLLSLDTVGATADSTGLTLERAWRPSSVGHIAWPQVRNLEITVTAERRGVVRYIVELGVQGEQGAEVVECPYDAVLCREIVSRAQLELRQAPEDWQTKAGGIRDPFDAIKRVGSKKQRWFWTRKAVSEGAPDAPGADR